MKNKFNAFSLIEVIMATLILTVAVFGVYKIISENSRLINSYDNYVFENTLFISLRECIDNIGFSSFSGINILNYNFNFGSTGTGCFTGTTNKVIFDNIEYILSGNITNSGSNFIDWELEIEGDSFGIIKKDYKLINN